MDKNCNRNDDYIHLTSHDVDENPKIAIDAQYYGNVARFINHDCKNFNLLPIYVMDDLKKIPTIALFACKDINHNEELLLDYGDSYWRIKNTQKKYCWCGTDK